MPSVPALSYSSVRTYLECPLRWKFLYVDRLPEAPRGYFSFGRTVHAVLEELLRPLVVPSARTTDGGATQHTLDRWPSSSGAGPSVGALMGREELLSAYSRAWVGDGYTSAEEEARYRALGAELLLGFYDRLVAQPPSPVAVEQHLEARWDGIEVHGYLDRIDRTPTGGLEILDYKTSRELSHADAKESDQLGLYQVLVERNYPDRVERLTLYHLRSLRAFGVGPRPADSMARLYDRVTRVHDGVRAATFDPTPGRQCARCEFKALCPEFREVPDAERERLQGLVDRFTVLRGEEVRLASELERTASELHRSAERLGVHRIPGSHGVALRRRDESWSFSAEAARPLLEELGLDARLALGDPGLVERLLREGAVDPKLRRRVAEAAAKRVRWYWEIEDGVGAR